jgi:ornithine cyclodeaminase
VCLHDLETGELLAVLDSAAVTAWRTGLASALGTHLLARSDATAFMVVGAGAQADLVVRGLTALRSLADLQVYDVDGTRAEHFAARHGGRAVSSLDVRKADVVVLATWSRTPLLELGDVMPGTHLTSLGADEPGKAELAPDLLRAARVIVDDVSLVVAMGALGTAGLGASEAAGTLSQVLDGSLAAQTGADEISVYSPVGLPWQDLCLAWLAYQRARATGVGQSFDFLG